MQDVDAEIAGSRYACESVHVGAVHVKQGAALVQYRGNFGDAFFEHSQRAGIRQHQRGDVVGAELAQVIRVNLAARV